MRLARIFLNPDGGMWFDVPLQLTQDCTIVFQALRGQGAIVMPEWIIPAAAVHHVQLMIVPDEPNAPPAPDFFLPGERKPN
jgi:hypothetical protein